MTMYEENTNNEKKGEQTEMLQFLP